MATEKSWLVPDVFGRAAFVRTMSIELVDYGKGWCETAQRVLPEQRQQHGFAHAGVVMTLADHTCGGAAVSVVRDDQDVITVENKTSFLRPAAGDVLHARATVLRAGKSLIFVEAEVTAERGEERVLVAKTSSTLAIIPRDGASSNR
ncbi:MAG TPA: PaaI family thioesterase [Verrucomicrobiae bacterium]|nr:PaaI family thioesterase [Verrucomicrobiae bacterium]